jgi:hypothetical protein
MRLKQHIDAVQELHARRAFLFFHVFLFKTNLDYKKELYRQNRPRIQHPNGLHFCGSRPDMSTLWRHSTSILPVQKYQSKDRTCARSCMSLWRIPRHSFDCFSSTLLPGNRRQLSGNLSSLTAPPSLFPVASRSNRSISRHHIRPFPTAGARKTLSIAIIASTLMAQRWP